MNRDAVIKGLKEAGRLIVFAIPGILIQVVSGDAGLAAAYGGVILTALKAVDRAIHDNPQTSATGILPF